MDASEEELAFGPIADRRTCSSFVWWLWLLFSYRVPMLGAAMFRRSPARAERSYPEEDDPLLKA